VPKSKAAIASGVAKLEPAKMAMEGTNMKNPMPNQESMADSEAELAREKII